MYQPVFIKCCSVCKNELLAESFSKRIDSKDRIAYVCKSCQSNLYAEWRKNHNQPIDLSLQIKIIEENSIKPSETVYNNNFKCVKVEHFIKKCLKCKQEKSSVCFNVDITKKDKKSSYCKDCLRAIKKSIYQRRKKGEQLKSYKKTNLIIGDKKWCNSCKLYKPFECFYKIKGEKYSGHCKDCSRMSSRSNSITYNVEKAKARSKRTREKCKQDPIRTARRKQKVRARQAKNRKDIHKHLAMNLRGYIRRYITKTKVGSTNWHKTLGYTTEELRQHIESLFTDGMTWEKLINGEIHIDHIVPHAAFYYESPEDQDFKECWALSNLRPVWASDNLHKQDLMPDGTRARNIRKQKIKLLNEEYFVAGYEKDYFGDIGAGD